MSNLIDLTAVNKCYFLARETVGLAAWCKQLVKPSYEPYQALADVNFTVPKGAAVGFIGPNGAGKSSLIKILCGIQKPTSGTVRVLGHNPSLREKGFLHRIGAVFGHKTSLWWDLPVKTSLDTYKEIYKIKDVDYRKRLSELTDSLNLSKVIHKPVRNLSLGERVKCELTLNLLHSPELIFLDEPTVGVDVQSKNAIIRYLQEINTSGTTIIYTSHHMAEAEEFCNRIALIDHGRVITDGDLNDLKEKNQVSNLQSLFIKLTGEAYRD